jgi:hypothetical protein
MVLWYLDYFHLYLGLLGNGKSAARWSAALGIVREVCGVAGDTQKEQIQSFYVCILI